ncbi:hypothetical protein M513_13513 [Trichuris suis]|uniref:Uncharacterized protein n=1 Tax=Trichuris suis TaxID=68888 RepID=A0A085LKW2_9BILA|nr:hypothetical protein M513_14120 [Trichuris suis]KFD45608.1 hypothetical protein M513_13513 [Trichuris suis]
MKINPYCILPLLFVLLAASKREKTQANIFQDSSSDERSSSNERDALLQDLGTNLEELFPPPPRMACENQSTKWSKEEKEEAAKNVFDSLLIGLPNPSEFTFGNLIVGAKCGTTDQSETILHMKVNRTVTRKCPLVGVLISLNKVLIYEGMIK